MNQKKQRMRQHLLDLRRDRELTLMTQGLSITEIGQTLGLDKGTISRDIQRAVQEARERAPKYMERLAFDHEKDLRGIDMALKHAWILFQKAEDNSPEKGVWWNRILRAYSVREEMLPNGEVVSQGVQYVDKKSTESNEMRAESARINAESQLALDEIKRLGVIAESESKVEVEVVPQVEPPTLQPELNQNNKENNDNPQKEDKA